MKIMKEFKTWAAVILATIALTLSVVAIVAPKTVSDRLSALTTNFTDVNVTGCYYIDDVCVLDGSVFVTGSTATYNGTVVTYPRNAALTTSTTTVCALQSNTTATSTLDIASLQLDTSSTSASIVTFARASTPYATTTFLGSASVAANAKADIAVNATTTGSSIASNFIFAPGQYLVIGMQGGTGTFSPTGDCSAEFRSVE